MAPRPTYNGFSAARPAVLGLAKVMSLLIAQLSIAGAAPIKELLNIKEEEPPMDADNPNLYLYLGISLLLVLLGGAFAGLTIALMGQDGVYLQVIAESGEGKEQRHAQRVFRLLMRGKHWVLVTLLLSNVITNETLPIVLDRSLGGGWPAVLSSTVLIVIFGEIIPQAVCVRYGMQIGAYCSPFVLLLMYIMAPVAWPTAKLLDRVLGEDHGTVYKKSGLKTLVTLHKTLGNSPSDRLNQDEVTIISAVLDLKDKPVGDIMTPMEDVFTMSADTVLDEETMDLILSAGYSRIPIFEPGNETNFVGMLLVKILITYDPEDCKRVSDFALATLPETRPETSCLDIVNFFQEGKSHMVLVSEYPGENYGGLGVVTLEDVIEELIGEEIIDESDVYIDVHKAIRRLAPAPKARLQKGHIVAAPDAAAVTAPEDHLIDISEDASQPEHPQIKRVSTLDRAGSPGKLGTSPKNKTTFLMRRASNPVNGVKEPVMVRANMNEMRDHLKHLGPSNLASRPRETKYSTVKIKPGQLGHTPNNSASPGPTQVPNESDGEGDSLLKSVNAQAAENGKTISGKYTYGSTDETVRPASPSKSTKSAGEPGNIYIKTGSRDASPVRVSSSPSQSPREETPSSPSASKKTIARSGDITQNVIDAGGVTKLVLETTSSDDLLASVSEAPQNDRSNNQIGGDSDRDEDHEAEVKPEDVKKKKKQRKRKRNRKGKQDNSGPSGE